jgi:propanol-preferring alcohol dehydrogenase
MDGYQDLGSGRRASYGDKITLPLTLGHETAGRVVRAGPDAAGVELGANVLVCSWIGCGQCETCHAGAENMCAQPRFLGLYRNGGFADFILVPDPKYLVDLGDLDPVEAAPLACSGVTTYSALKKLSPELARMPVVIIGAGGLGLMAIGILRMMGGMGAVVIETDPARRAAALAAGAIAAIDPAEADAAQQVGNAVGQPILAILDLVGNTRSVSNALGLVGRMGKIVVVGLMGGDINLPIPMLPSRALTLQGSYIGSPAEVRELVDVVKRHGIPRVPITRRPLSEASDAIEDLRQGRFVGRFVLEP